MQRDLFGIGLTGKTLTPLERQLLREQPPYAVVLFARNIADAKHLRALIDEVKSIAKPAPLFMMDEEGGRVDRLRHLLPGLPSAEAYAEGDRPPEMARWGGRVIGMALRWFGIEVDFAPVVDIRGAQSPKGLERRTFGDNPETVIDLAGAFLRGLHDAGTASCLKHFPGIGLGSADPHWGLTVIDAPADELMRRDLLPYKQLAGEAAAVMIGHGTYPGIDDSGLPASLSPRLTRDLLRGTLGFDGIAISDDMEMHAVADLGAYESLAERALMAGNDCLLFCSHVERVPALQRHLRKRVAEDAAVRGRFEEAAAACERYRAHCQGLRDQAPAPASFEEVVAEAARFVGELEKTRSRGEVIESGTPKAGPTGREEWT